MRHGSLPERNPPGDNAVFDAGGHGRQWRDSHFDVGARGEYRRTHSVPVRLVLRQDPFGHAAFAVIVARAEPGVIARFLQRVVEISVDEELDALLEGDLIAADSLIGFGLLTGVEPVDVDVRAVAAAEPFPQDSSSANEPSTRVTLPNASRALARGELASRVRTRTEYFPSATRSRTIGIP